VAVFTVEPAVLQVYLNEQPMLSYQPGRGEACLVLSTVLCTIISIYRDEWVDDVWLIECDDCMDIIYMYIHV
jgi:hypothetical protein